MTKKEQIKKLSAQNTFLRAAFRSERKRNQELTELCANLRIERDAADVLLGKAMDALKGKTS